MHIVSNLLFQLFVSRMKEAYTNAKISKNSELKDTLILTTGDIGRYILVSSFLTSLKYSGFRRLILSYGIFLSVTFFMNHFP